MSIPIKNNFKPFASNTNGNAALFFGLSAVPILLAAGSAIDYGRYSDLRQNIEVALDASVLAAASTYALHSGNHQQALTAALQEADRQFHKTVSSGDVPADIAAQFTLNATEDGFVGSATGSMPTDFLTFAGLSELSLNGEAEALMGKVEPSGDLEVSVMLDTTGSMCNDQYGPCTGGTKMQALKTAANLLIDKVVWEDQSEFTSKVALVPFANRVRIAQDGQTSARFTAMTNLPNTWSGWYRTCTASTGGGGSEGGGSWACTRYQAQQKTNWKVMPCVTDRHYNSNWAFDYTDLAPQNAKYLNAHDGSRSVVSQDSANTSLATSVNGTNSSRPATHWNYTADGACADIANTNTMMPLSNDVTALKTRINALQGFGGTAGTLGTAMTWYTLSPNWSAVWGSASAPKAYNLLTQTNSAGKPKLRKVAVLMTDGVYNSFRGWKDQNKSDMSTAAKEMCRQMKLKGIEIYTIGFSLNTLPASDYSTAVNTLQNCGTSVDHFYNTMNSADLVSAFEEIGENIQSASIGNIRIAR